MSASGRCPVRRFELVALWTAVWPLHYSIYGLALPSEWTTLPLDVIGWIPSPYSSFSSFRQSRLLHLLRTANRQTWREIPSSSLPTNHNLVDFTQSYPVQSIHPPSRPSSLSDCWSDLLGRAISLVSLFRLSLLTLPFPSLSFIP